MKRIYDDDDDEQLQQTTFLIICSAAVTLNQRCTVIERKRIDWHLHVDKLIKEGTFLRSYRMSHDVHSTS